MIDNTVVLRMVVEIPAHNRHIKAAAIYTDLVSVVSRYDNDPKTMNEIP